MTIKQSQYGNYATPNNYFYANDAFLLALERSFDEKSKHGDHGVTLEHLRDNLKKVKEEKEISTVTAREMFFDGFLWEMRFSWKEKDQTVDLKPKRNNITRDHFKAAYEENYGLQYKAFQKSLYRAAEAIAKWENARNKETEAAAIAAVKDSQRFILSCLDRSKTTITCNIADLSYIASLSKTRVNDDSLGHEAVIRQRAGKPLQTAIEGAIFMRLHGLKIPRVEVHSKDTEKYNKIVSKEEKDKLEKQLKADYQKALELQVKANKPKKAKKSNGKAA